MEFRELAACIDRAWSPVIGDPSALGWSVVAAYAAAALLSLAVALWRAGAGRERAFWLLLALLLGALAVNKQLDLQSALTAAGRCLARAQGWYDRRGAVQLAFIEAVAAAAVVVCLAALWLMRRHLRRTWPAIVGLSAVLAYVAIRAAGFHHVDRLISTPIAGVRVNPLIELAGIGLILANALWRLRRHVRPPRSPEWGRGTRARR